VIPRPTTLEPLPGDMAIYLGEGKGMAIVMPVPHKSRPFMQSYVAGQESPEPFPTIITPGTRIRLHDGKEAPLYHTEPGGIPCHITHLRVGESFYIVEPVAPES